MIRQKVRLIAWSLYRYMTIVQNVTIKGQRKGAEFEPLPKPPYVLLCNHANLLDPWFFAQYSKEPLGLMVNEDALWRSRLSVFMRKDFLGLYPKKKGATDPKAIKETLKLIQSGKSVLIFPEGQTTSDGETQPIYSGIEKIAKKMKIPIVLHNLQGNFLLNPWWADSKRRGGVITTRKVLSIDQVASLSTEELREQIISYISTNDVKNNENLKIPFHGKDLTAGMERILWICPACGSADQLSPKDNTIVASCCHRTFEFNAHLRLTKPLLEKGIHDFYDWQQMQIQTVLKNLQNSEEAILAEDAFVSLVKLDYRGRMSTLDTGKLTLTPTMLTFEGADGTKLFPLRELVAVVFSQKRFLLFSFENDEYRFVIEKSALFKWVTYLREATGYRDAVKRGYY